MRPRALLARLDVELDPLASLEAVEVQLSVEPRPVEEVLDAILGRDEAEPAVRNHSLDCSERHLSKLAPAEAFTIAQG